MHLSILDGEPEDVKIGLYSPQEQSLTLDGIKWKGKTDYTMIFTFLLLGGKNHNAYKSLT